jgi:2,5-furandicarboxylate decarboxylase 1
MAGILMTKINSLRNYIDVLEAAGQVTHIKKPVSLVHELANIAATLARRGGGGVLFEKPTSSDWPIFANAVVNQDEAALALECSPGEVSDRMGYALEPKNGIAPSTGGDAPWKQNILRGNEVDIRKLPIPTHGANDGGPFITGGVTITRDPKSGRGNLSYNRMQVLGQHTFGFNVNEWRHVMQFYKVQEDKNQPLQIAIAIGLDPAIMIAAGCRSDDDELRIAGAIRGKSIQTSKGITVDLDIPTEAEIVIEGTLPAFTRKKEGPLAEFHGYYGELWESPTFEVSAICFRNNPIYQTIVPGWAEHIYIGNVLPREPLLLQFVRHVSKGVTALHIPPYCNGFTAIVQINKSNPGEPKNVCMAAFTAHVNIAKVIVVDEDVNIYDPADLMWALTNRVDWAKDTFLIPGAQGHEMDPTADARGVQTKIGIDATYKPDRRDYGNRIRYPEVDLSKYQ